MPIRLLHVTQELEDWIDGPLFQKTGKLAGRTAYEHLEQFFTDFRCDEVVHAELRRMMPTKKGIWKMHPPMLRVYGWVPEPHSFVGVCAAWEADTKSDKSINDQCRDKVSAFLRQHQVSDIVFGDFSNAFPTAT